MKMKKKYIVPFIEVTSCILESFIAASDGDGTATVDDTETVLEKTEEEVNLHAKQFDAWSSWDD